MSFSRQPSSHRRSSTQASSRRRSGERIRPSQTRQESLERRSRRSENSLPSKLSSSRKRVQKGSNLDTAKALGKTRSQRQTNRQSVRSSARRSATQTRTQASSSKRASVRAKQQGQGLRGFVAAPQSQYTNTWKRKNEAHRYRFKLDGLQPQDLLAILARPVVLGIMALLLISVILVPKMLPSHNEGDSDAPNIPNTGFYTDPKTKRIYYYEDKQVVEGEKSIHGEDFFFDPAASGALFTGFKPQILPSDTSLRDDASTVAYAYYDPQDGHKVADQDHVLGQIVSLNKENNLISTEDYLHLLGESIPKSDELASFNGYVMTSDQETELKALIENFSSKKYKLGFVLQDLTTGQGISYGNTTPVYSASAIKAPYLASLLSGPMRSNQKLREQYSESFDQVLVSSDNRSYGELQKIFGQDPFQSWTGDLRLNFPLKTGEWYTTTTARDLSLMWLKMYAQYQAGDIPDAFAQMASHPETSAIYKNLSSSAKTFSKAGWYPNDGSTPATNDAGIVVTSQGSYLLSICSSAPEQFDMLSPLVNKLNEIYLKSMAPGKYSIAHQPEFKEN